MENKLLSRIFSYYPRENHSPKENFITEALAYSLNKEPKFNSAFLELIKNKLKNNLTIQGYQPYKWKTQHRFKSGNIPDLIFMDSSTPRIIIEVKVDSKLGEKQIERYKQEVKNLIPTVPVILIGKDESQNTQSAEAFITWNDIYTILKSIPVFNSEIGKWLVDELSDLLKTMEIIEVPIYKKEIENLYKNYYQFKKLDSIIDQSFKNLANKKEGTISFNPPFQSPKYYSAWGEKGLRWSKDTSVHNGDSWTPSIFMGIITDPEDHAVEEICKDKIPFTVVISVNERLYSDLQQLEEWKTFRKSVYESLSSSWKVLDRTEFSPNLWHPFIIHKPLAELFMAEEPISAEKAFESAIKEMLPIIQTAFDDSNITLKLGKLFKNKND